MRGRSAPFESRREDRELRFFSDAVANASRITDKYRVAYKVPPIPCWDKTRACTFGAEIILTAFALENGNAHENSLPWNRDVLGNLSWLGSRNSR